MRPRGSAARAEVLAYLSSFPGRGWVPGPLVRERCEATPASVNRALSALQASGRIEKMPDARDARRNVYRATRAPLRLVVGTEGEGLDIGATLLIDVMECGHTAVAHVVPKPGESPYVHDMTDRTVRRRCLECPPDLQRRGGAR